LVSGNRAGVALALCLSLAGCGKTGDTGFKLEVLNGPTAPDPHHLVLDWLDGEGFLFRERRVPEDGALALRGTSVAVIRIEVPTRKTGARRAIVRGIADEVVVSEGTLTAEVAAGTWQAVSLTLLPGRRPDQDLDGVPDEIDGCPGDPAVNSACPLPDAGQPPDGPPDDGMTVVADASDDPSPRPEAGPTLDGSPERPAPPDGPGRDAALPETRDASTDVPLNVPVGPATMFNCGPVLLVSSSQMTANDKPLRDRLTALGCALSLASDGTFNAAMASGKDAVVVAHSVAPALITNKLRALPVPVLLMMPDIFAVTAMTDNTSGTDWAPSVTEAVVTVSPSGHPLAAGLSGTVSFSMVPWPVGWGRPLPAARPIATIPSSPERAILFAFDAGAAMAGTFTAPAKRVGYAIHQDGLTRLNGNGWAFFDAAIHWMTGR
jgi:hypothetical protein